MTRSKTAVHAQSNWTNLPVELISVIMSSFTFTNVAKCAEINKSMAHDVDFIMRYINDVNDKLSIDSIDYVVNKCHSMKSPPYICGSRKYDTYLMRRMLKRWPAYLHLNWDMTNSTTISTFLRTISTSSFRHINHMSLKIVEMTKFCITRMNLRYMDLLTLRIDAEGCDLETIVRGINCRPWDVKELYLRGDVTDLGSLMIYAPVVSSKITIINTNDYMVCRSPGTENGIRYMMTIKHVNLCNIIKFCCDPPYACTIVNTFVCAVTSSPFVSTNGTWTIDRLNVDMIEALLINNIKVTCGVFRSEMERLKELDNAYPNRILFTSVL